MKLPDCWDRGFESRWGHAFWPLVFVVCSVGSRSLVQRSPTGCLCLCDLETWTMKRPRTEVGYCKTAKKKTHTYTHTYTYMYTGELKNKLTYIKTPNEWLLRSLSLSGRAAVSIQRRSPTFHLHRQSLLWTPVKSLWTLQAIIS